MSDEKVDETKCDWEIEMEKSGEKEDPPDFGNEFAIKSGIAYGVAFALFIPCFFGKKHLFYDKFCFSMDSGNSLHDL